MSYHKLDKERTVYCDTDDTLIAWFPENYKHTEEDLIRIESDDQIHVFMKHKKHIDFLWKLKAQGYGIVIFSAAGVNWVEKVVNKLGIQNLPDVIMSKPEFVIDDLLDAKKIIKSVIWIHPDTGDFKRNT